MSDTYQLINLADLCQIAWLLSEAEVLISCRATAPKNPRPKGARFYGEFDKLYLRAIWQAAARWQISSEVIRLGKTQRSGTDVREALPSQTALNVAIRHQWRNELKVVLNVQNVFDASVYEASRGPGPAQDAPSIPYDLPQTGRNLMLSVTKNW